LENTIIYHEIDVLLPAQRFNISFSYISQKGLPFVREFVLRLVHLTPMTKTQIAIFFGFSRREIDEAIADLVEREELMLTENGRLTLTEKSEGYFADIGEVPRLSLLRDSGTSLSFDLATFTCLGNIASDKWKAGISIRVDDENLSNSEAQVEKHFQRQFHEILHKGFLSRSLVQDEKEAPTVYTVKSVNKIRQMPFRLTVRFQIDINGRSVEREDFDELKSSDYVHEIITMELDRLARPNNSIDIAKAMMEIRDSDTIKLIDSKTHSINLQFLDDIARLEANSQNRTTFLGPIYSQANWELLQKYLAPLLISRIESKKDVGQDAFIWLAPSDPYWCKSNRLLVSLSDFLNKSTTKNKSVYSPIIYLPIAGNDDRRGANQWKNELDPCLDNANGIIEGFLGGNVEVLVLEGELAVVVYHMSIPENYPVTMPIGFISTEKESVKAITNLVKEYVEGSAGYGRPNDCGRILKNFKQRSSN